MAVGAKLQLVMRNNQSGMCACICPWRYAVILDWWELISRTAPCCSEEELRHDNCITDGAWKQGSAVYAVAVCLGVPGVVERDREERGADRGAAGPGSDEGPW